VDVMRHVAIRGRVQGVGFRAWTDYTALERGLQGWVRNPRDDSPEVLLVVPPDAVAALTAAAKVNLCLMRRANRDGHVMRSFEIAGSLGADILFPTRAVLDCQKQILILNTAPQSETATPGLDFTGFNSLPIHVSEGYNLYVDGKVNGAPALPEATCPSIELERIDSVGEAVDLVHPPGVVRSIASV